MNELRTTLDMGREIYVSLKCKQNDDRTLILTLLSNGVTWIPEVGSILELRGKRSDNTVTIQTTTGITIENNVVTIELSKEFTRVQGTVELELNIRKLTEITTFTFILAIEPSVIQDGTLVSTNTSSLLEELTEITDWGHIHLNNAINNVVTLTKKHSQCSEGLISDTQIVLPTVAEGEYLDIDYMFYANIYLPLIFDENIKWSSYPNLMGGMTHLINFTYINGEWIAKWEKYDKYIQDYVQDYIFKAGDTCDVLTGGYNYYKYSQYDLGASNDGTKITIEYGSDDAGAASITYMDVTKYTKLYVDLEFISTDGGSNIYGQIYLETDLVWNVQVGPGYARRVVEIDITSIVGAKRIGFHGDGRNATRGRFNIYNAWFEKDEYAETNVYFIQSGPSTSRPVPTTVGQAYFDTTLGKQINAKTLIPPVWVDGIGTVV